MSSEKSNKYSLTEGGILSKLLIVALPIMGTQIVQMAYNLTDMFWLGRVGSDAVAASGTVGMYLWLSMAFLMFGRMGAEIGVSQNLGRGDKNLAKEYGESALILSATFGILFGAVLMLGKEPLVGFFNIQEQSVKHGAESYLFYISIGIPATFITAAVTGIFNGSGNSRLPFFISGIGLIINMALDPLLIIHFKMGIEGAAIATVIAQTVVGAASVVALAFSKHRPFERFKIFIKLKKTIMRQIFVWATPVAVESFLFTFLTMIISRFIVEFGSGAMAAQKIGSQAESLSWLIAGGFSSALTAFVGQNFGAGKWNRIHKSFVISSAAMAVWGVIVTAILFFEGEVIFSVFLPNEPDVIAIGAKYLRILAVCQFVACLEGVASGAFRGMGKTAHPSIISATSNALRVVAAYFLIKTPLGLDGIWWAVSVGALVRGLWMYLWYLILSKRMPKKDLPSQAAANSM